MGVKKRVNAQFLNVVGSLSNGDADGDGDGDGKTKISKTTTLHMHHAFFYISLPSLYDYDVKRFVEGVNTK